MDSWPRHMPSKSFEIKPQEDVYLTLEKWPKEAFGVHYHDAFNWLVPMRPGTVTVEVNGRDLVMDGNHWICIFPNTPHAVKSVSDGAEVMSLFFSHDDMASALGELQLRADQPYIIGGKGIVAQGLAVQWAESRLPEATDEAYLTDSFQKFICAWLWSFYDKPALLEETPELLLRLKMDAAGTQVWRFIEKNLGENPFPWELLAQQLGASLRTFQRNLNQKLSLTPSELLSICRVEFSKRELRDPDIDLADIALKAGFGSQSHFSTVFKAHAGVSPGQFRSQSGNLSLELQR